MLNSITCLFKGHILTNYAMGMTVCQRCGLHGIDEEQYTKYKEKYMSASEQIVRMAMKSKLVRIVHGVELARLVRNTFPGKSWKFCDQTSPVYVPGVSETPHKISEDAVETWASGINGRHFQVSSTALLRHLCAKELIPEGNYLLLANLASYDNKTTSGLSDESTVEGPKGVV